MGEATIERNLISNNTNGVDVASQVTILNNTITNSSIAVRLQTSPSAITYNNIVNYTQSSLYLSSISTGINATYNWWGTTNTQSINFSIHDFKYDLNLGIVNFVPFLNEPNSQAQPVSAPPQPPVLPKFPSGMILMLLITAAIPLAIAFKKSRNRLSTQQSSST